jgi:hypothetical protein
MIIEAKEKYDEWNSQTMWRINLCFTVGRGGPYSAAFGLRFSRQI